MKKKSILSLSLIATLTFGTITSVILPNHAEANDNVTNVTKKINHKQTSTYKTASLKSFKFIQANHTVKIYQKPSTKSKVIETIKKGQGVVVLKKHKNGWSKISLQFATGYIQTKYLSNAKANVKTAYAMNTHKTYRYYLPLNKGSDFNTYYTAKFKTIYAPNKTLTNFWYLNSEPDAYGRIEYDTSKGLYTGYKDIGIATLAVKYPVKLNKTWKGLEGQSLKIVAIDKKVKTKAGTFKNVIVVKDGQEKNYSYYAPQVGLIKQSYNGKTISELSSIK